MASKNKAASEADLFAGGSDASDVKVSASEKGYT